MTFTQWLLDWAENHVPVFQFLAALITISVFFAGFLWARVIHVRDKRRIAQEYRELENPDVLVIEGHYLRASDDGRAIVLEIEAWGGQLPLSVFNDSVLQKNLESAARKRSGFIRLDQQGQYLLRAGVRDLMTGNDWASNHAALSGRPVHKSLAIACPVTWPGVRDAHLIRVLVVDAEWIERLVDDVIANRVVAADPHYQYRVRWLHDIARAWQQEKHKDANDACMWGVTLRSIG
jgi:hypothetical protein